MSPIVINNMAAEKIDGGCLWLGRDAVVGRKPRMPGVVGILNRKRAIVAHAFLSPDSRYYLRIIPDSKGCVDREFWRVRVLKAYARRAPLEGVTNAFRVVHAEADGIPSVAIDRYNDIWTVQVGSAGAETIKGDLVDIIAGKFRPEAIILKNNSQIRKVEDLPTGDVMAMGKRTTTVVKEGGQEFELDVLRGQKTGAYLDYRKFRLKAAKLAFGDCLDAFCYQGWFSCHIARAAKSVVAVDSSGPSLDAARRNADINGHKNVEFVRADVFDYLCGCGRRFDFIHLDPPSFAKGEGRKTAALLGYKKLIKKSLGLLNRGGIFFVSSCSHAITEGLLEKVLDECVAAAGLSREHVFRGIQDIDHPILKGFPESLYLKAAAVKTLKLRLPR